MEKKYQIFISSTYEDLIEERKKVQDTILSMYQFPIGMEMFSAADEEQWEIIQETIDSSDYYVLIIGHRYGSVIEDGEYSGISYTQKEFRYALEKKIPILAFIIDDSVPITVDKFEQNTIKKDKLKAFIQEIKTGRTVEWWTSIDDLANKVMNSLNKQISRGKRPGWVRADKFDIDGTQSELVEMSKKIRSLEVENEKLRSKLSVRRPDLIVEINDNEIINLPYVDYNTNEIELMYSPMSMDDVPMHLKSAITQVMIDEYNNHLPSKDTLNEFKSKWKFYKQAKENPYYIDIKLCNIGNKKAKDIYVEIMFPDDLILYKKNSYIVEPDWPHKGKNPIEEFYKNKKFNKQNISTVVPNYARASSVLDLDYITQANSSNKCFYNEDNSLSIRLEDLMTDYTWSTGEKYFIVPKQKGIFNIVCSFVCEEYEESIEQIIKVIVE